MKKGNFISVWDEGTVITSAILDEKTGSVETNSIEVNNNFNHLIEEVFETEEGDEYDICPECHEFVLKSIIEEGVGKSLHERRICSNPECNNQ
jgi:phospholipid N-methyltransferase